MPGRDTHDSEETDRKQGRGRTDEVERENGADDEDDATDTSDARGECHRRGCTRPASFRVLERYQEETGHGAVEAEAQLCRDHTAAESPTNLDGSYAEYVFRVDPIGASEGSSLE